MGEIFTKFKNKTLNACYSMKEGDKGKNYGSTMIPKVQGVHKSLFCISTPKGPKI